MRRKPYSFAGDGQIGLFSAQIERFSEVMMESVQWQAGKPAALNEIDTEDEFYGQVAEACKAAIKDSGMSRAQVLDKVNEYLRRNGRLESLPHKRPISIHMFNNFLSKPTESPMRLSLVHAICKATGNLAPYKLLMADLGAMAVTLEELAFMQLGKLQFHTREIAKIKRQLTNRLCGPHVTGPTKSDKGIGAHCGHNNG